MQNTAYWNYQIIIFGEIILSILKKNERFFIDFHSGTFDFLHA